MIKKYNDEQIALAVVDVNNRTDANWSIQEGMLYHSFDFPNFVTAFGFITQVALVAQKLNHHPDWRNSYKHVEFYLSTHKCNGISELDFKLANAISELKN